MAAPPQSIFWPDISQCSKMALHPLFCLWTSLMCRLINNSGFFASQMYEEGHSAHGILCMRSGILSFVTQSLGRRRRWPSVHEGLCTTVHSFFEHLGAGSLHIQNQYAFWRMVSQSFGGISCSLLLGTANGGSNEGYWVTVFAYICNYTGLLERPPSKARPIGENGRHSNRGTSREQHKTPLATLPTVAHIDPTTQRGAL